MFNILRKLFIINKDIPTNNIPISRSTNYCENENRLKPGMIIDNPRISCKVLEINNEYTKAKILITYVNDEYLNRYVDAGKEYSLFRYLDSPESSTKLDKHQIWQIPEEEMKRNVSLFLLVYESEIGWTFDLDF